MNFNKIPAYFRPTEIIIVDDDRSFLDSFLLFLPDNIICKTFQHPQLAIDYLNSQQLTSNLKEQYLTITEEQGESPTIDINIHKEIYNENRFSRVSLLITDYSMPGINGITLCNSIKNKRIKKLLLTGEASNELAVQAFNNGEIDKFLLKKANNVYENLLDYIISLQVLYHEDFSDEILPTFLISDLAILKNKYYISIFNKIITKFKIIEFYILDANGSYIMLDNDGICTLFVVRKKSEIVELVEFAKTFDTPKKIIEDLEQCEEFPYFYSEEDFNVSPEHWGKYMHKCKKIHDDCDLYYTIINSPNIYNFKQSGIISYKTYLDI